MIDNTQLIRDLLRFPDKNSFYFLQIIKRRKDNPEMEKHSETLKQYYIYSYEDYDLKTIKAKELCNEHNARAYFCLNVRDSKKIAFKYNRALAELLDNGNYKAIPDLYSSVVGKYHQDTDRKWIVDVDNSDELSNIIRSVYSCYTRKDFPVVQAIPTKNGHHLVTRPFRFDVFRAMHSEIDVHKNSPTILYIP